MQFALDQREGVAHEVRVDGHLVLADPLLRESLHAIGDVGRVQGLAVELRGGAQKGAHGALGVGRDQHHAAAGLTGGRPGVAEVGRHAMGLQVLRVERAELVVGHAAGVKAPAAQLRQRHPRLVTCDISGYGEDGPYADMKAYDLLIQSESGFLSVTGTPDEPAKAGASIADIAAGMYAYSSILAALLHRDKTGEGAHIDVSMLESLTEWMGFPMYYAMDNASPPPRNGASHATIYPYGPFLAGDGHTVMLGLQNEREWVQFCESVLQQPGLASDPRFNSNRLRHENRAALEAIILNVFSHLTAAQVIERLDAAPIANARMNTMAEVWTHPQLQARRRWVDVDSPVGPLPALLPPGLSSAFEYTMGAIPRVGEHNEAILAEFGLQL